MKRILFAMAMLPFIFASCSSANDEPIVEEPKETPIEVSLYLDFEFSEGGNMSRTNADTYTLFYDEKIKTKALIPDDYSISFTNSENSNRYDFTGKWSQKDMVTILEGTYVVNGASISSDISKCSIKFTKDITVSPKMESLTLTAEYSCFLLMFNKSNFTSLAVKKSSKTTDLPTWGDYYYAFFVNSDEMTFEGVRSNGATFSLKVADNAFSIGKYYFFNDITSSFDIPEMEAGN